MVPEAPIERTEAGLAPAGPGWFVLNAREARWRRRPGRGNTVPFTGWSGSEQRDWFPQLGVILLRLEPGEPIGVYHWEKDAEAFLVLSGEALLIVEGQERPLRQWDFVHCPPETRHMIVAAGSEPCLILAAGSREHGDQEVNGGAYPVDPVALSHGAGVEEETSSVATAYGRYPDSEPARYREGWLPDG